MRNRINVPTLGASWPDRWLRRALPVFWGCLDLALERYLVLAGGVSRRLIDIGASAVTIRRLLAGQDGGFGQLKWTWSHLMPPDGRYRMFAKWVLICFKMRQPVMRGSRAVMSSNMCVNH